MKKNNKIAKVMMLLIMLMVCMCVPVKIKAATFKQGAYTYSTKTIGDWDKEKTTIYRQKKGGKKQKLVTISGTVNKFNYIYDNKLFYERLYGGCVPPMINTECINLRNKKRTVIAKGYGIVGHRGRYAMVMNGDYYFTTPVYIVDVKTKKMRWIANDVLFQSANIAKDGRIYYMKCVKRNYKTGNNKYTVYSCRKDGSGRKKIRSLYSNAAMAFKVTDKYIVLGSYGEKGRVYRY